MNIYLDDERPCPNGYTLCRWPSEVIEHLKTGQVERLSLDHDLAEEGPNARTGHDVLTWLLEQVVTNPKFQPPAITVHTANPVEAKAMKQTARRIMEIWEARCKIP